MFVRRPQMPIQELLTGVTFPSPTMNVNTLQTPAQYFGSLLLLWLKGDAGVTADGSGNASAWADQSGNGHNLAPPGGSVLNPPIVTSAQNGLPGVQSTNATANVAPFLQASFSSALDLAASTPFSVCLAYKPASDSSFTYDAVIGNMNYAATSSQGWVMGHANSGVLKPTLRLINTRATAECSVSTATALTTGTAYNVILVNSGSGTAAGITIYVNGTAVSMSTIYDTLGGATTQTGSIGVKAPACGTGGAYGGSRSTLLEAFVVNKAMTARDAQLMDAYLNGRWAVHS